MSLSTEDVDLISSGLDERVPGELAISVEFRWDGGLQSIRPSVELLRLNIERAKKAILSWLQSNVRYVYIPAARNVHDFRRGVFAELIAGALNRVRRSQQRLQAIERFFDDVKAEIAVVEDELVTELRQYLPWVKDIKFKVEDLDLDRLVSVGEVDIDDGARTPLQQKGDGFKSLCNFPSSVYCATAIWK